MARLVMGAVGAGIGFLAGGAVGARWGFLAGTMIGGMIFAPDAPTIKQEGPRLSDLAVTSAGYGASIPFGIGTTRIAGDIIWCPGIRETVHKETESSGGKGFGGGKGSVETITYTYSVDCAVMICRGPINGVTRVWADGKLIIDRTGTGTLTEVPGLSYRLYLGTDDQMPDPLIEADKGVGQVPAHRGTAYMVFENFGLVNFAGHIPTFTFEVTTGGSTDYPIIVSETPATPTIHVDESRGLIYTYLNPDLVVLDLFSMEEVNRIEVGSFTNPCIAGGREGVVVYSSNIDVYTHSDYINKDTFEGKAFPIHTGPTVAGLSGITQNSMAIVDTAISHTIVYRPWFGPMQAYSFARGDAPGGLGTILKDTDHYDSTVKGVPGTFSFTGGLLDTLVLYGNNHVHTLQEDAYHFRQFGAQSHSNLITLGRDEIEVGFALSVGLDGSATATVKLSVTDSLATTIPAGFNGLDGTMFHDERDDTYVIDNQKGITGVTAQKIDPKTLAILSEYPSARTYANAWDSDSSRQQVGFGDYWSAMGSVVTRQDIDDGATVSTDLSSKGYVFGGGIYHMTKMGGGYGITTVNGKIAKIFLGRYSPGDGALIRDYIESVLTQCGLDPTLDADLSEIDQTVYGYYTATNTAGRSLLQPLAQLFAFDVVESDYVLKFVKRNKGSVATITTDQMVANNEDGNYYTETIKQEVELPAQFALIYSDPDNDYGPTTARAMRPSNPAATMFSQSNVSIQAPATMRADQAKGIVEMLLYSTWNERRGYDYGLSPRFLYLDPADVVTVQDSTSGDETLQRIGKNEIGADLSLSVSAVIFDAQTYVPSGIAADAGDGWHSTIPDQQSSQLILLDVPMLRDADNIPLVYTLMSGYGRPGWRGGLAFISTDGETFKYRFAQNSEATIGIMLDALPATDRPFSTDNDTVVRVQIQTQPEVMAGTTQADMLTNFANAAAVKSGTEWEIIQFRDCVQVESDVFELSGLLRGRKGTDYCTDNHKPYDRFVLLQPADVSYASFLPSDITKTFQFKVASPGQSIDAVSAQSLTYEGNSLRPYAPVQLAWTKSGADLVLTWQRRTRFGGEMKSGTAGVDTGAVPLNESTESYRIVVMSGPTTLATYDVTGVQTWTYTAAQQTADGFGPGGFVVIHQMSEIAGPGFPSKPLYYGANADVAQLQAVVAQTKAQDVDVAQLQAVAVTTISEYLAVAQLQPVVVEAPKITRIYQAGMAVIGMDQPHIEIDQAGMAVIGMIIKG